MSAPAPKYKVGDRVIWTNVYGVCWGERTITEVLEPDKWEQRYMITPTDTPWMYVREPQLAPHPSSNTEFGSW
jgi:hypothetical protein